MWKSGVTGDQVLVRPPTPSVVEYMREHAVREGGIAEDVERPYANPEWFDKAIMWIVNVLKDEADGYRFSQLVCNSQSCVVRVVAPNSDVFYMKTVAASRSDEVRVTCSLAKALPDHFHHPVAVDLERRWMLMKDYGSHMEDTECGCVENSGSKEVRSILLAWSATPKESVAKVTELRSLGVPVVDGPDICRRAEVMMNDPEWYKAQREGTVEERYEIRHSESEYKEAYRKFVDKQIRKLGEFQSPMALVHGDLNPVNVIESPAEKSAFFNFGESSISFPFLNAIQFAAVCICDLADMDYYLQEWTEFESLERLRELLQIVDIFSYIVDRTAYESYSNSCEGYKLFTRQEMKFPMCRWFDEKE